MKIEIKKLIALKKYSGEFEFDYTPSKDMCLVPLCEISSVSVRGSYDVYEDYSVGVKLTVSYRIFGKCSFCLKDASKEVEETYDVTFVPYKDDEDYSYDGTTIDLKTAVDDAILFSQPKIVLCRDDCTGIDVNE